MGKFKLKNLLLVLAIGYICFTFVNQQIIMHRQKVELKKYNEQLQKVKEENSRLQEETNLAKDNPNGYIERLAREKLGLIKEKETPVINSNESK